MSIKNKLALFIAALIILPMSLLMLVSNIVLNGQLKAEEQKYLNSTWEIVSHEWRTQDDIRKVCGFFVEDDSIRDALSSSDSFRLTNDLQRLQSYYYKNIDYALVVTAENKTLANVSPNIKYNGQGKIGELVKKALSRQAAIQTMTCRAGRPFY
jgi:molybdopterin/thiamine biosynthesis adenylyltransferase